MGSAASIEPGQWVRHPAREDWGAGQVQSVVGTRITVNFEHAGKILVNAAVVTLDPLDGPPDRSWT
ncbi:MAG: DUF3553 domain-containing protein [Rhodospirillales bacterium 69-11]|jgi:hypothetical protein|nr:DUF3553 domain-containing protein [Rhodospirillales bacterium]OJW28230.1 MAG: DUF3553 domain-containing protein [Rhodospirillales bacterium 69-11]